MGARQNSHFHPNFADLIERPPIGPVFLLENLLPKNTLPQSFEVMLQLGVSLFVVFRNRRLQLFLQCGN